MDELAAYCQQTTSRGWYLSMAQDLISCLRCRNGRKHLMKGFVRYMTTGAITRHWGEARMMKRKVWGGNYGTS
jgi:hypothetical protein